MLDFGIGQRCESRTEPSVAVVTGAVRLVAQSGGHVCLVGLCRRERRERRGSDSIICVAMFRVARVRRIHDDDIELTVGHVDDELPGDSLTLRTRTQRWRAGVEQGEHGVGVQQLKRAYGNFLAAPASVWHRVEVGARVPVGRLHPR